jgi:hypothetical protein
VTTATRDPVSPDLRKTLRALKLGQMLATLPERPTLARQQKMAHADFLELVLADEVTRREAKSASLRARAAGLHPGMRLDTWDQSAAVRYDQQLWNELASLRFLDGPHGALILGPVGVGKTHMASALGHIAVRRRRTGSGPLAKVGVTYKHPGLCGCHRPEQARCLPPWPSQKCTGSPRRSFSGGPGWPSPRRTSSMSPSRGLRASP